jgi:hypothetical protein
MPPGANSMGELSTVERVGDNPASYRRDWLPVAVGTLAGAQVAHLITHWLRDRVRPKHGATLGPSKCDQCADFLDHTATPEPPENQFNAQDKNLNVRLHPPNPIIRDMYLEITNISQALNIGLLAYAVTNRPFYSNLGDAYYSPPLFTLSSLIITVIFWTRYHFDTAILNRSYRVSSTLLFFLYGLAQGASVSLVGSPLAWMLATGALLFFGVLFYACNLREIRRKQKAGVVGAWLNFVYWQRKRMTELIILSFFAFLGAYLLLLYPALALPGSVIALIMSLWQAGLTGEYRTYRFFNTGV